MCVLVQVLWNHCSRDYYCSRGRSGARGPIALAVDTHESHWNVVLMDGRAKVRVVRRLQASLSKRESWSKYQSVYKITGDPRARVHIGEHATTIRVGEQVGQNSRLTIDAESLARTLLLNPIRGQRTRVCFQRTQWLHRIVSVVRQE